MRIDPKYFNLFVLIIACFAFLAIVYFTLRYKMDQNDRFRQHVMDDEQVSERWLSYTHAADSVQLSTFKGKVVVIYFWATWASRSESAQDALTELQQKMGDELVVLAASVKDNVEFIDAYLLRKRPDFIFVNGTRLYQDWKVPGVPSFVVLGRNGDIAKTIIGFRAYDDFIPIEAM